MTSAYPISGHSSAASAPRQRATSLASALGFDESHSGAVALVVSELATNIAKHAREGHILLRDVTVDAVRGVEVLAVDKGPGMEGVERVMTDGYSTAGTLGGGLGAVRRLSDQFELFSQPGVGSIALARLWSVASRPNEPRVVRVAAVSVPKAGETVCGDAWDAQGDSERPVFMVVDGLGHGPQAADAAALAVAAFRARVSSTPGAMIDELHEALRSTRGAAVAIAALDKERRTLHYAGVGNIIGAIVTAAMQRQNLASLNGTAGHAIRRVQEFSYRFEPGAALVMHSDGLSTHWNPQIYPGLWRRDPALAAGALYRDYVRGRDDSTVLVAQLMA